MRGIPRLFLVSLLVAGCRTAPQGAQPTSATATIHTATGSQLGVLRLEATMAGVRITGTVAGLSPGAHGIHVHATGRCDAPQFESAGPHFNPARAKHGLANPEGPHNGDLPAIGVGSDGQAVLDATTARITLDGAGSTGVFDADGASIVIHAANDDQRTDPSGNSGARVACGVIARGTP